MALTISAAEESDADRIAEIHLAAFLSNLMLLAQLPTPAAREGLRISLVKKALFERAMSQLMSAKSIKIRYHLHAYRMVPEGSDSMRYVKQGNLDRLKLLIHSGEATPWDAAPDGWSLLHVSFLLSSIIQLTASILII